MWSAFLDNFLGNYQAQLEITMQVVIAGILGGIIGVEREVADKPAGIRTHSFVASAAALLVGLAGVLLSHFAQETAPEALRADPIRVVEAIVTGVAFLGAGTIFRQKGDKSVEGLTTAASLLLVAGIGISVALSQWLLAVLTTCFTLILLRVVQFLKPHSSRSD